MKIPEAVATAVGKAQGKRQQYDQRSAHKNYQAILPKLENP
jgi:hypothetical protein